MQKYLHLVVCVLTIPYNQHFQQLHQGHFPHVWLELLIRAEDGLFGQLYPQQKNCDAHLYDLNINIFWFCSAPAVRSYWFWML